VSAPPYDSANLSTRVADDPAAVRENRNRLAAALGLGAPRDWWWLQQVHGTDVVEATGAATGAEPCADAAVTARAGTPLVVLTADCAPLALACDDAAAVVHAGWTGLLAGVVEEAVARLRATGRGAVRAVLGPCVHPARYQFGRADLERVVARLGPSVEARTDAGEPALDLPAGVRAALRGVGVETFDDVDVCTATSPDYFSYRREGETGRQALVLVLDA
jgi:purine-nucleoside/S-methyl-5'-thioadenosine phosphorylase / adenosine deaminase